MDSMNRRAFLRGVAGIFAAAAVPAVLMPERRIWQVGAALGSRPSWQWELEHGGPTIEEMLLVGDLSADAHARATEYLRSKQAAWPKDGVLQPGTTYKLPAQGFPADTMWALAV